MMKQELDSNVYSDYARRKIITSTDVVYSLKRKGTFLYGFI